MITKIFTPKPSPIRTVSTSLYKIVAIMLIIKRFENLSIPKLQVYMWGLQYRENLQKLKMWKIQNKVTEAPWLLEDDIIPIISQCISNHFLKIETNKSKKVTVALDSAANDFLQAINEVELVQELNDCLNEIGKLTDKMLENIEFDF